MSVCWCPVSAEAARFSQQPSVCAQETINKEGISWTIAACLAPCAAWELEEARRMDKKVEKERKKGGNKRRSERVLPSFKLAPAAVLSCLFASISLSFLPSTYAQSISSVISFSPQMLRQVLMSALQQLILQGHKSFSEQNWLFVSPYWSSVVHPLLRLR